MEKLLVNEVIQKKQNQIIFSIILLRTDEFLSRVSILTRDIDIANMSVCLAVRLSVTFRYRMKTT